MVLGIYGEHRREECIMINIGVDLRILNNAYKTGIERYSYNLFSEICKFEDEKYYLIGEVMDKNFKNAEKFEINIDLPQSNTVLANKMLSLMGYISDLDLLHSPYFPVPKIRTFKGVLTIHDLIPLRVPEWFGNNNVHDFFDTEIRETVKYIDHIIADSQATKNDIIDLFSIDENKISVVYLGVDQSFINILPNQGDNSILEKYDINSNYILSVCTVEPRKNIQRILKSYEILRERHKEKIELVLVGRLGWKYENLLQMIKESKFSDDIILTGYVPDEDLLILYRNAEVFMYPSLYEGFGLPILEAMSCEAPVITSNVSSLPEVGGDSVMYCDPYDVESIVYTIEEIITKPSLQKELREKGKIRAQQFSWKKAAEQTRQIYLDCLK
jgi:glycosyltransferase involved in cell wall biosynthesis